MLDVLILKSGLAIILELITAINESVLGLQWSLLLYECTIPVIIVLKWDSIPHLSSGVKFSKVWGSGSKPKEGNGRPALCRSSCCKPRIIVILFIQFFFCSCVSIVRLVRKFVPEKCAPRQKEAIFEQTNKKIDTWVTDGLCLCVVRGKRTKRYPNKKLDQVFAATDCLLSGGSTLQIMRPHWTSYPYSINTLLWPSLWLWKVSYQALTYCSRFCDFLFELLQTITRIQYLDFIHQVFGPDVDTSYAKVEIFVAIDGRSSRFGHDELRKNVKL